MGDKNMILEELESYLDAMNEFADDAKSIDNKYMNTMETFKNKLDDISNQIADNLETVRSKLNEKEYYINQQIEKYRNHSKLAKEISDYQKSVNAEKQYYQKQIVSFKETKTMNNNDKNMKAIYVQKSQKLNKQKQKINDRLDANYDQSMQEIYKLNNEIIAFIKLFDNDQGKKKNVLNFSQKQKVLVKYDNKQKPKKKTPKKTKTAKKKNKSVPDWDAIHNKHIFSNQIDLKEWNKRKEERIKKLFGSSRNNKMSTSAVPKRRKSMIGKKSYISEKKLNKKRASLVVPSSNDHKFDQNKDSKLNRKIQRILTPNSKNIKNKQNKKASIKPSFDDSFCFTENTSLSTTDSVESTLSSSSTENNAKKQNVPKEKLAFDPSKIKSKLFESTSSSLNKKKIIKKGSKTPSIVSRTRKKSMLSGKSGSTKKKNWSAVKSKIDTGRTKKKMEASEQDKSIKKLSGTKRRLSFHHDSSKKNDSKIPQPAQKKRRMSTQPQATRRWQ